MRHSPPPAARPASSSVGHVCAAAALLLSSLAIYVLRLDHVAGLIGDDAWYTVMAKAISQGQGPRLISAATTPFLSTVYPPGFPALLSLVFLINPQFPDNLMLLKGVSIAAAIGAGVLTYRYALVNRGLPRPSALAVAFAATITPALVFIATSTLMSEAVFLLVQLCAVLLIDRAARVGDIKRGHGIAALAGVLAAAALLTRTAGITVLAAGVLYFARERRWRSVVTFGITAALCFMPWWMYARAHAPTRAELIEHGGLMAVDYAQQFWTSEAGQVTARQVGVGELPGRVVRNVTNIAIRDIGGIFVPLLFRTPSESGVELVGLGPVEDNRVPSMGSTLGTKVVSLGLTALVLLGFVVCCRRRVTVVEVLVVLVLGMVVLWPFWTFRFVLPLTPFLLCYLATGVETLARSFVGPTPRSASMSQSAVRIFLAVLIGLNLLDHSQYIAEAYGVERGGAWKATAADSGEVLGWLRQHAEPDAIIAADNPAYVYLWTGRRTVAIHSFDDPWSRWRRLGVRYLISLSDVALPTDPARYALRFKLPDKNVWVVELIAGQSVASATQRPERVVR